MELYSGAKMVDDKYEKTNVAGLVDRKFTVVVIFNTSSSQHNVISTVIMLQGGQSDINESWQRQQIYYFLQSVQSSSGAYPALYSVSTRSLVANTWGRPLSSYSAKDNGWSFAFVACIGTV
jgi:hypothetical protein